MIKLTPRMQSAFEASNLYISKSAISSVFSAPGNVTAVECYDRIWYVSETVDQVISLIRAP